MQIWETVLPLEVCIKLGPGANQWWLVVFFHLELLCLIWGAGAHTLGELMQRWNVAKQE